MKYAEFNKVCTVCNKLFYNLEGISPSRFNSKKICSKECLSKSRSTYCKNNPKKRLKKDHSSLVKTCRICGKEIYNTLNKMPWYFFDTSNFCSPDCKLIWQREDIQAKVKKGSIY